MQVHLGVKAAKYENGESLSDVMVNNHYGTETIPPRPVLRIAAEKYLSSTEFKDALAAYFENIKNNPIESDHKKAEAELMRKIGVSSIAEAKRIIQGETELRENAPATIAYKGFNKPLFEKGLMIKNLSYEIVEV
ncbi:MAG: hypothetical protein JXN64_06360 [Spirochaetes bacterium]|nr:hypothetical protein [Spirochaetota bacterium]